MSTEAEFDLDKLFLPSWAKESPSFNKYTQHSGEDRGGGRERRGGGGNRRPSGGDRPPRRDFNAPSGRGPAPQGERRAGPRREGGGGGERRGARGGRPEFRGERPAPAPLPEIKTTILPDEKGVELLAKQIKMTGRAYPIFDIARLILEKPERQQVKFETIKKDDKVVQPLFLCMLDDTLWLSEQEAISHVLDRHFETFYKAERTPTEPPKGVFTFVAQCGMSGIVLGPPNYHGYQDNLRRLHQERFSRVPFEVFKSRVKIVKDEAVVKKWLDEQSFKTEFTTLNVPEAETKKLQSRDEVEQHFRQVHLGNIVKPVESHTLSGPASRKLPSQGLQRLVRREWEDQQKFPLKLVNFLSQQFASRGLQFFKVNKQITHVAVARPHYLDLEATPVSECVRKIVEFINTHPKCTRRDLVETLAPSPTPAAAPVEGTPAEPQQPTAEQTAIIADLHWLVHQGHVIEFANGILETAKKPKPKPEPKPAEPKKEPVPGTHGETLPNESVEVIEPQVSALEATQPGTPVELTSAKEIPVSDTPENLENPEKTSDAGAAPENTEK